MDFTFQRDGIINWEQKETGYGVESQREWGRQGVNQGSVLSSKDGTIGEDWVTEGLVVHGKRLKF